MPCQVVFENTNPPAERSLCRVGGFGASFCGAVISRRRRCGNVEIRALFARISKRGGKSGKVRSGFLDFSTLSTARHSHSELVLAGHRLFSPAPLKHSSRTSGMLSVLELADLGSSHLSRVLASRRSLKRLLGGRSSSRLGLGGPMATVGL